ncbi:MAG: TonB-dependent receptor [Chthoniobacterales bacterium]
MLLIFGCCLAIDVGSTARRGPFSWIVFSAPDRKKFVPVARKLLGTDAAGDIGVREGVQTFLKKVKKNLVTSFRTHYSLAPNLTQPMEKLMIKNVLNKLGSFPAALAVGIGIPFFIASSAFAQVAPVEDSAIAPAAATTDRVIVTGSYIPTAETESALPVTVYTAEVLQKQGANTVAEGLRQLPSFVGNTTTENDSNGGDGTAQVNLRALGAGNTLTLINGRRAFNFSDINLIGIGAISRTEVLKDGASSIYGADAVAGVINFLTINSPGGAPYEGGEIFALYGNTTDTDAHVIQTYLRGGLTGLDGKASVAFSAEYYTRANLFSRDRLIASTGDKGNDPLGLQLGGQNTNSPTFGGRASILLNRVTGLPDFTDVNHTTGVPLRQPDPNNPPPATRTIGISRAFVVRDLSTVPTTFGQYRRFDVPAGADPFRFNFRAFTPAIPAQERFDYYVNGQYKIFGDGLVAYGDVFYSHLTQDNGLAPPPFSLTNRFNGLREAQMSIFNPFGDALQSVAYRLVNELGSRRSFFDKDATRYSGGLKGDFNFTGNSFISHFGYDTGFVYDRFNEVETDTGDAQRSGIVAGIAGIPQAVGPTLYFNPLIGVNAAPRGTAPTYTYNPATGASTPTGNFAAYDNTTVAQLASYTGTTQFLGRDWLADIKVNAHLFPNLYNGGIDFALGYEHRQVRNQTVPDNVQLVGDQLGFNGAAATRTTQEADSFFGELIFPVVTSTMNIPFVRSFEIGLAFRHEKFKDTDNIGKRSSSFDNSNPDEDFGGSPRIAIRYQPIADLTLRATASQSYLAPTPGQLFQPVLQDFPVLFDPAVGSTSQPTNGVFRGGNPNLSPETTDEYTTGLVYSPSFIHGLTLTVDYYNLFTTNLIVDGNSYAQFLLTSGIVDPDGAGNGAGFQGFPGGTGLGITRNGDGTIGSVDSSVFNAGRRNVQGLDITAVYQLPTSRFGTFTISGGLNHFFTYKIEAVPGQGYTNFLGDFSATLPLAPGAIPFNKGFLRGEWEWKGFDFNATMNYIGDYEDDPNFILLSNQIGGTAANPEFDLHRRVTQYITLDMQLSYEFVKPTIEPIAAGKDFSKDGKSMAPAVAGVESSSIWKRILWGTKLTVGVNNAFDRNPPTTLGAFNDNYDTSLYSIRNRYWYVSLKKTF